jgi:hypothetical protein
VVLQGLCSDGLANTMTNNSNWSDDTSGDDTSGVDTSGCDETTTAVPPPVSPPPTPLPVASLLGHEEDDFKSSNASRSASSSRSCANSDRTNVSSGSVVVLGRVDVDLYPTAAVPTATSTTFTAASSSFQPKAMIANRRAAAATVSDNQTKRAQQQEAWYNNNDNGWRIQNNQYQAYNEWRENSTNNQVQTSSSSSISGSCTANQTTTNSTPNRRHKGTAKQPPPPDCCWWRTNCGQLAILDGLPTMNSKCRLLLLPRVVAPLPPGSTIIGVALVTLQSDDFSVVSIRPQTDNDNDDDCCIDDDEKTSRLRIGVYPIGRPGWIQMLQLDYYCYLSLLSSSTDTATSASAVVSNDQRAAPPPAPHKVYVVLSHDGYPFLGPGLPACYGMDATRNWIWRVTCLDGAMVRLGLELFTEHVATIPFGSLVHVHRKAINAMGLARLQVTATITSAAANAEGGVSGKDTDAHLSWWSTECITGWCSQALNPQSGQVGSIMEPLPFPVPALYRILPTNSRLDGGGGGAVIRSGIELSHPQIGQAPVGAVLSITGRDFSEHPSDQCLERLRLAGSGGWISLRLNKEPPGDLLIATLVGLDPSFDPAQAGQFRWNAMRRVKRQQKRCSPLPGSPNVLAAWSVPQDRGRIVLEAMAELHMSRHILVERKWSSDGCQDPTHGSPTISSVEEDEEKESLNSDLSSMLNFDDNDGSKSTGAVYKTAAPSCSYTATAATPPCPTNTVCLICLCQERTATLCHGGTGHICCCLSCARIVKARGDPCPVCRLPIDAVIQHFWA